MQLGPVIIYQCPKCPNLISNSSMSSGNSIDSKRYSDGKIVGPMLSTFPVISICSKCNAIFWFSKIKEVDRYEFILEKWEKWISVETARFLSVQEYFTGLETQLAETTKEEYYIRKSILVGL